MNWDTKINLGILVITTISVAGGLLGTVIFGWIKIQIELTRIKTENDLKILGIQKDVLNHQDELSQHGKWFFTHAESMKEIKEEIMSHLSGIRTDIEVIKTKISQLEKSK